MTSDIYGLRKAVTKQIDLTLAEYNGIGREGDLVIDVNPGPTQYQLFVTTANGSLTPSGGGGGDYSNANVANYLPTYTGNIGLLNFQYANTTATIMGITSYLQLYSLEARIGSDTGNVALWANANVEIRTGIDGINDKVTTFNSNGSVSFPTLTVDLHNGGNQTAQTLQFGSAGYQSVITGPTPDVGTNAQRIIIQGQRGTGGEGGDVYLWGGDSDVNGGDIKIYAGDADGSGYGGYINLDAGSGFDGGGQLTLTGGYSANGQGGPVYISSGQGTDGGVLNINGGGASTGYGGYVNIQGGFGQNNGGAVTISGGGSALGIPGYGPVQLTSGVSSWVLDNTGNLQFPSGGSVYSESSTPSGAPGNTITLNPHGSGSITNQKFMIYPTAGDGDHIHMTTGNLYETELFLGSDGFFVKLSNTGNVVVNTNDGLGIGASWTFGTDGNLYLPAGYTFIKSQPGGYVGLAVIDDGTDQPAQLLSMNANTGTGTTAISSYANQALIQANINGDIKTWAFNNTGNLGLPGNTWSINYANGSQASAPLVDVLNTNGLTTVFYPTFVENRTDGQIIRADVDFSYRSDDNLLTVGNINMNGSISNVGDITAGSYGSPAPYLSGFSSLQVFDSVNIGGIIFGKVDGTAGQVLTTYGNGTTYWSTVSGGGSYGNSNVATFLASYGSNTITTTGNATFGNITVNGQSTITGNATGGNAITAGVTNTVLPNTIASFSANVNYYTQVTLQNRNTGADATADYIATADNGSDTVNYLDMGIINSGYDVNTPTNSLGNIVYAADSYIYAQGNTGNINQSGGNLAIGTTTPGKNVKIFVGGVSNSAIMANISNTGMMVNGNVTAGNFYGTSSNVSLVSGIYSYTFDNTGNVNLGTGTVTLGNVTGNTAGFTIGYRDVPQLPLASNTTLGLTDAGKHYFSTTAGNITLTIPANNTVAFNTGTAVSVVLQAAGNILVNAASGVSLYMAGNSTSANRVIGAYGMATLLKVSANVWFISGTGVS